MACGSECNQEVGDALRAAQTWLTQNNQATTGDPVNVVTGAFLHSEQDVAIPSQRLFITLERHYNNQRHWPISDARQHPFGPGWTHSLGMRLQPRPDGCVAYFDDRGSELSFALDKAERSWVAPPGSLGMTLHQLPDEGFHLRQVTGLRAEFNVEGRLVALIQPGPRRDSRVDLSYDADGRLTLVAGAAGRGLEFTYHSRGFLICGARDHSGRRWRYEYNDHQELEEVCDPAGRRRRYEYCEWKGHVADGRKTTTEKALRALKSVFAFRGEKEASPGIAVITNWYTTERRVYLQRDGLGAETRFEYNPFAQTTVVTNPLGDSTVYCFDEAGSTTKVRKPSGSTTEYVFDARRNLLAEIDPLGHRTEYVDFREPEKLDFQMGFGRRAIGNRSAYLRFAEADLVDGYDLNGNRPLIRNALGFTTRFRGYTAFGQPTEVVLADGTAIHTEYNDRSGLPVKRTRRPVADQAEPLQFVETWDYDDLGCCSSHRSWAERPDGSQATSVRSEAFEYDEVLQLLTSRRWMEDDATGASFASEVQYEWDSLGRVVKETIARRITPDARPEFRIRQFGYDCLGRLLWELLPDASAIIREYDTAGHIAESFLVRRAKVESLPHVAPELRLRQRRWVYDAGGREIRFIDPIGAVTIREWDRCSRCIGLTAPSGQQTTFTHDRDGNLMTECNASGQEIRFTYDAAGRFISRSDNLGYRLFVTRDALGRNIRVSHDPDDTAPATRYSYDALGRIADSRFADDAFESLTYDGLNNVCQRQRGRHGKAPDSVESCDFDGLGRLRSVYVGDVERRVQKFRYEYSGQEREVRCHDALGNITASRYDSEGALIERLDADGRLLRFSYDEMGRLVRRWSDDGSVDSTYSYDYGDLLAEATEPGVQYRWEYDSGGRVRRHRQEVQGRIRVIEYDYDDAGRLTGKRFGDDWWVRLGYSSSDLPSQLSLPGHTVDLAYDPAGRLIGERWQAGGQSSFGYSAAGVLTEVRCLNEQDEVMWEQSLELDERQRPARKHRRSGRSETVLCYRYDALNRLIERTASRGDSRPDSHQYHYDDQNNRIREQQGPTVIRSYVFDAADRLLTVRGPSDEVSRSYDRSGLLVADGRHIFRYDAAHRLRGVAGPQAQESVEFQYSATGELALSTRSGNPEWRFYDGSQEVVRHTATKRHQSFWGLRPDCLIAWHDVPRLPSRIYTDLWGSVLGEGSGEPLLEYGPFGESAPPFPGPGFGFASKCYEPLSGLYFNRARFYDPTSGRFTQPDPKGLVDGPNLYAFARNNPMAYGDPDGTEARHHSQGRIAEITAALAFFPDQKEGRTYIVGPSWLESRVHAEHFDAKFNLIGRSYIISPGLFESKPHVEHYDTNWNLAGRSYVEGPGLFESHSHFQHYGADWSRTGRTYSEGPGLFESQPHFQHYDSRWGRAGRTYIEGPGLFESHAHFQRYA